MSQLTPQALPDISRMNALKKDILKRYHNSTYSVLPALRDQLKGLVEHLSATDQLLANRVLGGLVMLEGQSWGEVDVTLEQIRRRPSYSEELRQAELRSQIEVFEEDALRDMQRLDTQGQELIKALEDLGKIRLPEVEERIDLLQVRQQQQAASIAYLKPKLAELDALIDTMGEVILAFEAPSLEKILNGLIPTESELALVQQAVLKAGVSPELLISAARTFLQQLSTIVGGRRLIDLINAREQKQYERSGLVDELRAVEARQACVVRELDQLPMVAALMGLRDEWVEEALGLSRGWTEHLQAIRRETELQPVANALYAMQMYLAQVRSRYEQR